MNPTRFHFHRPYQQSAYQALSRLQNVTLLHNSRIGAESYAGWLNIPIEKMRVIRNGFDLFRFRPKNTSKTIRQSLDIDDNARIIGSVFRLVEEKRPLLWIDIAAELSKRLPNIFFLIIGDGPMSSEIESYINSLGLSDRFRILGAAQDIAGYLSTMDIVLLTSRVEGLPNVLIEAQLMGVPVVASNVGGVRETIAPTMTDHLVSSDSPKAFTNRIITLLTNQNHYAAASEQASHFAQQAFSGERMIDETINLYNSSRLI